MPIFEGAGNLGIEDELCIAREIFIGDDWWGRVMRGRVMRNDEGEM